MQDAWPARACGGRFRIVECRGDASADEENDAGNHQKDKGRAETDGEIGAVADGSDDLGGKRIAEAMNDEEVQSDGCGTNLGSD